MERESLRKQLSTREPLKYSRRRSRKREKRDGESRVHKSIRRDRADESKLLGALIGTNVADRTAEQTRKTVCPEFVRASVDASSLPRGRAQIETSEGDSKVNETPLQQMNSE